MNKSVVVPLANGFEEIEAVSIIDILRRGGVKVIVASIEGENIVKGAHGIGIESEAHINDISSENIDMVILPGGWGGTTILAESANLQNLLKNMDASGKLIGAICAAPYALDQAGVLKKNFTCYPSSEEKIKDISGYDPSKKVVRDGNVLTSRGPATAICFALEILKELVGEDTSSKIKEGVLADFC